MKGSEFKDMDFKERIKTAIKKIVQIQKPNGVIGVEVSVDPISNEEYYVDLIFLVPEDSELLKRPRNHRDAFYRDDRLFTLKHDIAKYIQDYLSIKAYINSYGVRAVKT